MFPGHRAPESKQCQVPRPWVSSTRPQSCIQGTGFHNQTSVMLPGHRFLPSNLSHVPRKQVSRIKPMSCSQDTGFQYHSSSHVPSKPWFHHQTSVMLPVHRFLRSNQSLVPRPQGYRIKPYSYTQATGYHHQTSVMFPGHRVPPSNLNHGPRTQGSRIKPMSTSQAMRFQ